MSKTETPRPRVVVGVDGSQAARHALLWAAQEARLRRSHLLITHIDPPAIDAAGLRASTIGVEAVLKASAAEASGREPGIAVGTLLLHGQISDELVRLSSSANLLVIGVDPTRSRAAHGALGAIEDKVVVQARCPVVAVTLSSRSAGPKDSLVVVGWTDSDSGRRAMHAGAEEACVRAASLVVVTVSGDGLQSYGPVPPNTDRALVEAITRTQRRYPGLAVQVVREKGEVAAALTRQSLTAELLVIGCRHTDDRWSIRTGRVAGTLMRESPTPVILVGQLGADLAGYDPAVEQSAESRVLQHTR
jgi:nucleotide-binding universal stress UspA family protein